jgi:anti-sigma regulatory factor (Ser/Thr protein kinase)
VFPSGAERATQEYVTPAMRISLDLPSEPNSIPRARRALQELKATLDPVTFLNLRLLVSELVTNAVRHVPGELAETVHLEIERTGEQVRVEVVDRGEGFVPRPRPDGEDRASGWGLNILAKVASRWGVENNDGARVWFEIDAPWHQAGASAGRGQGAVA